jgi:glycosyltransferase involved in cell wall biosynthesis
MSMKEATTTPLQIAMISYYLPSGSKIGVGYQVHALANAMFDRGHQVTVFSACTAPEGARYKTETIDLAGGNRTFRFALKLRQIDWSPFDVLHAHGDDYWLWRSRCPVHVRTFHGSCFSEARWVQGFRERLRMVLLGLSEVVSSVVANETVAVSDASRQWMPWVRRVIPNGTDLRRFHPRRRSPNPSLLFVGTYTRRKRGRLLAEVFEQEVLPAIPTAELWMVCEDAPDGPGIKVLGRVSDEDLADLYGRAWAFCLPSTYEGFGIPYIEAMASGCPVVATPNAGAMEVTARGRFGLLVDPKDLGRALVRILTSSVEREALAAQALVAVAKYDLDAVAGAYEDLYVQRLSSARVTHDSARTQPPPPTSVPQSR